MNINQILETGGILLVGLIVFAESGLLVGFFLPGDTLLFPAGLFAAQGKLPLLPLIAVIIVCAVAGDNTAYFIGKKTGKKIFKKEDGLLFRADYLRRAEKFYEKHGGKTIMLARFLPLVRTFAPVVAGAAEMPKKRFVLFDLIGCISWGAGVTLLGYYFGSKIPNIDAYILPAIGITSLLTFGPSVYHIFSDPKIRKIIASTISKFFQKKG